MSGRFFPALAVVAAVIAFGAAPALAATQGCHTKQSLPPSVNVYVEQQPNSGSCPKKPVHHSTTPTSSPTYPVQPTLPVHPKVQHHAKHPRVRKHTAKKPVKRVHAVKASARTSPPPSAVSAAFDLGSGPTALFAALLAAAALLAVGGGLRHGRRR